MGRVFVTILVPVLLPTAAYVAWRLWFGRDFNLPAAWVWLFAAGLVLAAATLVAVNLDFGGPRTGAYIPPHVEDGTVVPGHVDTRRVVPEPAEPGPVGSEPRAAATRRAALILCASSPEPG